MDNETEKIYSRRDQDRDQIDGVGVDGEEIDLTVFRMWNI